MKLITSVMVGAVCAAGWAVVTTIACLLRPEIPAITIVAVGGAAFVGGAWFYAFSAGGSREKSELKSWLDMLDTLQVDQERKARANSFAIKELQADVAILQEWRRAQEEPAKVTVSSQWPNLITTYPIKGGGSVTATATTPAALTADALLVLRDLRDRIRGAGGSSDKHQGALLDECLEVLDQIFGEQA